MHPLVHLFCLVCWVPTLCSRLPQWRSGKQPACQCRRHKFNPWRRKRQLTPVFLPGKLHGQRSLAGYSSWGSQRAGRDWAHTHTPHTFCVALETQLQIRQSLRDEISVTTFSHTGASVLFGLACFLVNVVETLASHLVGWQGLETSESVSRCSFIWVVAEC